MAVNENTRFILEDVGSIEGLFERDDIILYVPIDKMGYACGLGKASMLEVWSMDSQQKGRRNTSVGDGDYSSAFVAIRGTDTYWPLVNCLKHVPNVTVKSLQQWYQKFTRVPALDQWRPKFVKRSEVELY